MIRRKVLVCGATGFIGRNLVERLAARNDLEVHAVRFTRPEYTCAGVQWHQADLRRMEEVEKLVGGFDVLIQAAATTSGAGDIVARPYIHTTDNAVMNSLLLRAAYEAKVGHFVFFSCTVMHQSSSQPLDEMAWDANAAMEPRYFASGWTKVYIEKMCEFFAGLGVTRHTVIRHSNIFGPYDKFDLERSHVFGATVTKVMTATDGTVRVWGTGEEQRDLLYVADLVDFVVRAVDRQTTGYELFNVGSGRLVSVRDLVASIVGASGRDLQIMHDLTRPTIPTAVCLDCRKAERLLDWKPGTSLADGIAATVDWWKQHHASR
ncbi:MAG: fcl [Gammaproteobacteria bacterium]|nr:fcl [Gammaproteobacteria bacterium]